MHVEKHIHNEQSKRSFALLYVIQLCTQQPNSYRVVILDFTVALVWD